jgi:hypothetical protein
MGFLSLLAAKFPLTSVERDSNYRRRFANAYPFLQWQHQTYTTYPVILRRSDRMTLALSGKAAFLYFNNLVFHSCPLHTEYSVLFRFISNLSAYLPLPPLPLHLASL